MRIEFDPTNPDEAAAVRAMLTAMHPTAQPATLRFEDTIIQNGETQASEDVPDTNEYPNPTLDSTGTPWDARIHSTPPTTNKDGTWRAKRGVKAEEIAAVRAEREMAVAAQDPEMDDYATESIDPRELDAIGVHPDDTSDPAYDAPAQEQSAPPAPNAPVGEQSAPPAPPAPIVQPEPVVGVAPSFLDVMKAITATQKDGKIDTAKVKELCAAVGAGESTMGLNGPDNGDKRVAFMALLASETEGK